MRKPVRNLVESPIEGGAAQAILVMILETSRYVLGAGVLFYLVDVLLMGWQGLSLH